MACAKASCQVDPARRALHHGGDTGVSLQHRLDCLIAATAGACPWSLAPGRHFGASRRGLRSAAGGREGWWHEIVGPGKALDTDALRRAGHGLPRRQRRQHRACCRRQRFPASPATTRPRRSLRLLDHLGSRSWRAIVGASYGGMVALAFGERYPQRVERLIVISAARQPHPMATAWRSVQRNIARLGLARGLRRAGAGAGARAGHVHLSQPARNSRARFRARAAHGRRPLRVPGGGIPAWRAAATTPRARGPSPSSACPNPSTCTSVDAARIAVRTEVVAVREDQLVPHRRHARADRAPARCAAA